MNGNTIHETYTNVEHGMTIDAPDAPSKDGCTFLGWSDGSSGNPVDFATITITNDLRLSAIWEEDTYNVEFFYGDTLVEAFSGTYDEVWDTDPVDWDFVDEGKTFIGWYTTPNFEEGTAVAFPYTITGDATWYAKDEVKTYTVTFMNGNTIHETYASVEHGMTIDAPDAPSKDGHTFVAWGASDSGSSFDFASDTVTADITLNARFAPIAYTITIKDGERTLTTYTKNYGDVILENELTSYEEKTGHSFIGWYTTASFDANSQITFADADNMVSGDATWYAKFAVKNYAVTFYDTTYQIEYEDYAQSVAYGSLATKPADPDANFPPMPGYVFAGWEDETGKIFDFEKDVITQDTMLREAWVEDTATPKFIVSANGGVFADGSGELAFDLADETHGVLMDNGDGTYSVDFYQIEMPSKEGYKLHEQWGEVYYYDTADCTGEPIDIYAYTFDGQEDATVYVKWLEVFTVTFDFGYGQNHDRMFHMVGSPLGAHEGLYIGLSENRFSVEYTDEDRDNLNNNGFHEYQGGYLPYLWRYGYVMKGYSYDEAGENMIDFTKPLKITEDLTLYLQWTELAELSFVDGEETTTVQVHENDHTILVARIPVPAEKADKSFFGWWTKDGSVTGDWGEEFSACYNDPAMMGHAENFFYDNRYYGDGERIVPTTDTTFYARWEDEVALTYDANGGVFENDGEVVTSVLTVSSRIDNNGAQTFLHGATSENLVIKYRESGVNQDACLGWSLTQNGTLITTSDITGTIKERMDAGETAITLYAVWEEYDDPMVVYDANGGVFSGGFTRVKRDCYGGRGTGYSYYYPRSQTEYVFSLTAPEGYKFVGWYSENGTEDDYWGRELEDVRYSLNADQDDMFYARYELIDEPANPDDPSSGLPTYTYDANGGLFWDGAETFENDIFFNDYSHYWATDADYIAYELYNQGYAFVGWYSKDGTDGDWGEEIWQTLDAESDYSNKPTDDRTYYAKWVRGATYTFDGNGGRFMDRYLSFNSVDRVFVDACLGDDGLLYLQPPMPHNSNEALRFRGWFTKDGTGGDFGERVIFSEENYEGTVIEQGDKTLYARWEVLPTVTYTITLHGNGFDIDYSDTFVIDDAISWYTYGETLRMTYFNTNNYDYNLVGFSELPDGELFDGFDTYVNQDITLYAIWEDAFNDYDVRLYDYAMSGYNDLESVGGYLTFPDCTDKIIGYDTFIGWMMYDTSANAVIGDTVYKAGDKIRLYSDSHDDYIAVFEKTDPDSFDVYVTTFTDRGRRRHFGAYTTVDKADIIETFIAPIWYNTPSADAFLGPVVYTKSASGIYEPLDFAQPITEDLELYVYGSSSRYHELVVEDTNGFNGETHVLYLDESTFYGTNNRVTVAEVCKKIGAESLFYPWYGALKEVGDTSDLYSRRNYIYPQKAETIVVRLGYVDYSYGSLYGSISEIYFLTQDEITEANIRSVFDSEEYIQAYGEAYVDAGIYVFAKDDAGENDYTNYALYDFDTVATGDLELYFAKEVTLVDATDSANPIATTKLYRTSFEVKRELDNISSFGDYAIYADENCTELIVSRTNDEVFYADETASKYAKDGATYYYVLTSEEN